MVKTQTQTHATTEDWSNTWAGERPAQLSPGTYLRPIQMKTEEQEEDLEEQKGITKHEKKKNRKRIRKGKSEGNHGKCKNEEENGMAKEEEAKKEGEKMRD